MAPPRKLHTKYCHIGGSQTPWEYVEKPEDVIKLEFPEHIRLRKRYYSSMKEAMEYLTKHFNSKYRGKVNLYLRSPINNQFVFIDIIAPDDKDWIKLLKNMTSRLTS